MKTGKKYQKPVEWAKNYYLGDYQLIQQNEIELYCAEQKVFNKNNPCNIYFILRRAKVTVNPDYCRYGKDFIELEFRIHEKDTFKSLKACINIKGKTNSIKFKTVYPYIYFSLQSNGQNIIGGKASVFIDQIQRTKRQDIHSLDLDVLYIGQSLDETNDLSTVRRLLNHSKIQTIYKEQMTNRPDTDIWVLLCAFDSKNFTMFGFPTLYKNLTREFKKVKKLTDPQNLELSKKHKTNILEAALINYFQPTYNKTFKNDFPSKKHTSYSEVNKMELNALMVELDTSMMNLCLFSKSTNRQLKHSISYDIISDNNRFSIFDLTKNFKDNQ